VALESVSHISDLVVTNPVGATDPKSEGDDHIRNIKTALKTDFPNINGAVSASDEDLSATENFEETISATTSEVAIATGKTLNITDNSGFKLASTAVTSTAAELNILDGATLTVTEANQLDKSVRTVSGYNSGAVTHIESDSGASATSVDIESVVTVATWESVGPTGSGADNIWTALDSLPSTASSVIIKAEIVAGGASTGSTYSTKFYAREGDSTTGISSRNLLAQASVINRSASQEEDSNMATVYIPVTSSQIFDAYWAVAGTTPTPAIVLWLVGWVE